MNGVRATGEYVAAAERYVANVLSGKQPAAKWLKLAVKRHVKDKKRSLAERAWPYYFNAGAAERPCQFAEMLPHVKGKWAKRMELIHLEDWECFILCSLFGWLVKAGRPRAGLRRFIEAYLEICRKNGKSVLAAIIGLFLWSMDGEAGAEVYSGATTEKQAWEVFLPAKLMVEASPELLKELGQRAVRAKSLLIEEDHSRFEPMIGKPGDGASPHGAIVDEFHEHDTADMVETMRTGMLAREQPLLLQITTAGSNLAGPCYDKRIDVQHLLEGNFENEQLFAIIYTIDEDDDWADPAVLLKANPNFGVSVDPDILLAFQRQAVLNPAEQTAFKTKHLNIWCAARTVWMPLDVWDMAGDTGLDVEDFAGWDLWEILDLASKDDIAARIKLFRQQIKEQMHYYFFENYYVPQAVLDTPGPNQVAYRKWAAKNYLHVTDGKEIDFDIIEADTLADFSTYQLQELIYDPWRATQLAHRCEKAGATVVEVRQTVQNMSQPMKELLAAAKGGRVHHACNPVTRWMMGNVTAKIDAKDNIYPRKEKPHMKIDGPVGMIMGLSRVIVPADEGTFEDWARDPIVVRR